MGSYGNTGMCFYSTQYSLFRVSQSLQLLLHLFDHHGEWGFSVCRQICSSQFGHSGTQTFGVLLCQNRRDAKNTTGLGENHMIMIFFFFSLRGIIVSQVAVWQHSLLEGVVLRCWQCLWTGRCWVWTSPACHKGKAPNPWWRVDQRLPLRRQGCKVQFKAKWILQIQIHINHNSFFIFKTHHLPGIYTPWISHSYSYNSLSRYNECSRTTLWRTLT